VSRDQEWAQNPFYVLGLPPEASRVEVERAAARLLGALELGLDSARTYVGPYGPEQRTPELVRQAAADLRDPARRLLHELWAVELPPPPEPLPAWEEAAEVMLGRGQARLLQGRPKEG
jgi:hypothetical protein